MALKELARKGFRDPKADPQRGTGKRRLLLVGVSTVACLGVGLGSAWASSTSYAAATASVKGKVSFSGNYKWYSAGDNHGGFDVGGTLTDRNKSNGRSVKLQVRIEGYSPKTYTAATDKDLGVPYTVHWTGDETVVTDGYWQVCQNNTVTPDDCSGWTHKINPYS